jgi:ATP-dependent DNA ligase
MPSLPCAESAGGGPDVSLGRQPHSMTDASQIFPIPVGTAPMEAKSVDRLPDESGWQYEPKWDGFRCLAFKAGDVVELRAKSGKSLSRYFPDMMTALKDLAIDRFVVDGELAIPIGDTLSFDALQMRLHPAESRVRKLAAESPAILILFDCLADRDGRSLISAPFSQRRAALEDFVTAAAGLKLLGSLHSRASLARRSDGWITRVEPSTAWSPRSWVDYTGLANGICLR